MNYIFQELDLHQETGYCPGVDICLCYDFLPVQQIPCDFLSNTKCKQKQNSSSKSVTFPIKIIVVCLNVQIFPIYVNQQIFFLIFILLRNKYHTFFDGKCISHVPEIYVFISVST